MLPSLLLNYFGQGALLLLNNPTAIQHPVLSHGAGLVALSACGPGDGRDGDRIPSGDLRRLFHDPTSGATRLRAPYDDPAYVGSQMGQIYMPGVNWALLLVVVALVLTFKSSTSLAAAYGIAVTGTMIITTSFAFLVARNEWQWSQFKSLAVFAPLMAIDIAFFAANAIKIQDGGWFPLVFGAAVFTLLSTWKNGRERLSTRLNSGALPLQDFIVSLAGSGITTVPGTAIFMTPHLDDVPNALLHNLKHNKVLHESNVIATVVVLPVPRVLDAQRLVVERLSEQFYSVKIFYGFTEHPDVPAALEWCSEQGLELNPMQTSFFLGRETVVPKVDAGMAQWREKLFVTMFRNAGTAASYFRLPPNRVVELGTQVVL